MEIKAGVWKLKREYWKLKREYWKIKREYSTKGRTPQLLHHQIDNTT